MAMLLTGIIVALSVLLAYGLSTILVKPLASVTKSIEDLTDGYQKDEIQFRIIQKQSLLRMHSIRCLHV